MASRIVFLDILKIIAIFLVCSCHFLLYQDRPVDNLVAVLACGGVPLFFMVNGALLMTRPFDIKKHWRRTGNLIMVLLIWKLITPLAEQWALGADIRSVSKTDFLQYLLGGDLSGYVVGHFWFMNALIGIYILLPMLKKCYDDQAYKKYIYALMGITFFFSIALTEINTGLDVLTRYFGRNSASVSMLNTLNPFGSYGYCLFFFLFGAVLYEKLLSAKNKIPAIVPWLCIFAGWAWLFGLNRYQNSYTNAKWIVINGYERTGAALLSAGIFILAYMAGKRLVNAKILHVLSIAGNNTLGVYYTHVIIGTWIILFYDQYIQQYGVIPNIIKTLVLFTAGLLLSLICGKIPVIRRLFKM